MDIKARRKVIDDQLTRLKTNLDITTDVPEHWDQIEMQWLMVRRAEWLTSTRTDLSLLRKSFKLWALSEHLRCVPSLSLDLAAYSRLFRL